MRILLLATLVFASCASQNGNPTQTMVNSQGEFAQIKVEPSFSLTHKIVSGDAASAQLVSKNPENYNPPTLAAAANLLLDSEPDRAMYLFYLGQLRARSDTNKSLDPSARAGMDLFNHKFGSRINQYAFKNISKLQVTVEKVIADDREIPRNYDPRWIALHGLDAFNRSKVRFKPQSQWETINAKTRNDYYSGFKSAISLTR